MRSCVLTTGLRLLTKLDEGRVGAVDACATMSCSGSQKSSSSRKARGSAVRADPGVAVTDALVDVVVPSADRSTPNPQARRRCCGRRRSLMRRHSA